MKSYRFHPRNFKRSMNNLSFFIAFLRLERHFQLRYFLPSVFFLLQKKWSRMVLLKKGVKNNNIQSQNWFNKRKWTNGERVEY